MNHKVKLYTIVAGKPAPTSKQAAAIVGCLENGPLTRAALLEALGPKITTRQNASRVLSYWEPVLVKLGVVSVEKGYTSAEVETAPATTE
jgi:hypothetical protein